MTIRGLGDRWLAGEQVDGVAFARDAAVRIVDGAHAEQSGTIAMLVTMTPEPSYVVALSRSGAMVRVRQSALREG